ncbi:MAG: enoyl-CoA hydratase/isomerase family protein [bacterium]
MTTPNHYLYELRDGVGIVTLNRPERFNAVTWELAADLVKLFASVREDEDVRTILLTGAGKAFCAGGDADFVSGNAARPLPGLSDPSIPMKRSQRKTPGKHSPPSPRRSSTSRKPVIAAIHGACVPGAGLAALCTTGASPTPPPSSRPSSSSAASAPTVASWFLPRIVPLPVALMMVETGKMFSAEESKAVGLVGARGQGLRGRVRLRQGLATGTAWPSTSAAASSTRRAHVRTLDEMLDYECVASTMTSSTRDAKEGVASILEAQARVEGLLTSARNARPAH